MMQGMYFANPELFWLLLVLPLLAAYYILKLRKKEPTIRVSSTEAFSASGSSFKQRLRHLTFVIRMLIIVLLIIVLARPQSSSSKRTVRTEGIDICLALDISGSMLSEDFKPNRIEAAKKTAMKFIDERKNDRIGLVVFSAKSFTQCPITIDHDVLKNLFSGIKSGMIEDGTAIGMGLATSVDRLKDSKSVSKVIILLTDGINNTGMIAPMTAAEIAKNYKIRVYTVGVGTRGKAPYPMQTPFGVRYVNVDVEIDEPLLKNIAGLTGGKYFRATNNKALENIYQEIDKMEKIKIDESIFRRYTEEYLPFGIAAIILFIGELFLRFLFFRKLP